MTLINKVIKTKKIPKKSINILRELRKARGMTLYDLGKLSGISSSYISRLESNNRRLNTDIMQSLAQALGCSVNVFLEQDAEIKFTSEKGYVKNLPIYNVVASDASVFEGTLFPTIDFESVAQYTFRLPSLAASKEAFALYIVDNANEPKFSFGDLIFMDGSKDIELFKDVLLVKKNNQIIIGKLIFISEDHYKVSQYGNLKKEINIMKSDIVDIYSIVSVLY